MGPFLMIIALVAGCLVIVWCVRKSALESEWIESLVQRAERRIDPGLQICKFECTELMRSIVADKSLMTEAAEHFENCPACRAFRPEAEEVWRQESPEGRQNVQTVLSRGYGEVVWWYDDDCDAMIADRGLCREKYDLPMARHIVGFVSLKPDEELHVQSCSSCKQLFKAMQAKPQVVAETNSVLPWAVTA